MTAYRGSEWPFENAPHAVVAIKQIKQGCFHVGIIHRSDEEGVPRMLHLAWHYDLQNNIANPEYFWVQPGFHPVRARQVASFCRLVARRNPMGLPYAFSSPDRALDLMTGEFLIGPTTLGLTCASFVLAVFAATGLSLVVLESWPMYRDEDEEWQEYILQTLKEHGASPAHITAVRSEKGFARYHPTEVAAASSMAPPPATLEEVKFHAERFVREIMA